jgi:hypothetical protein
LCVIPHCTTEYGTKVSMLITKHKPTIECCYGEKQSMDAMPFPL